MALPVVAFTMGDPSGIGPEIVSAAVRSPRVLAACRPLLIGARSALKAAAKIPLLDPGVEVRARPGRPTSAGAAASFAAFKLATQLARRGLVQAVVTAPISKEGWRAVGVPYGDHTEYLERQFPGRDVAMMLMTRRLRTVLATRHIALKRVPALLSERAIVSGAALLRRALSAGLGVRSPRLAVCALNPHAGEGGLLGTEEALIARAARRCGARGPLPADAAWPDHRAGRFDGLISIYHDQALIALKLDERYGITNWTLGLPIIRTSPGHGTAFDIAGKRRADPGATIEAALLAARLAGRPSIWR